MNDVRFAFRQLLKNPGFATVAVLTLALGIGANTAIFGVVDRLLVQHLDFGFEPSRVVLMSFDLGLNNLYRTAGKDSCLTGLLKTLL